MVLVLVMVVGGDKVVLVWVDATGVVVWAIAAGGYSTQHPTVQHSTQNSNSTLRYTMSIATTHFAFSLRSPSPSLVPKRNFSSSYNTYLDPV